MDCAKYTVELADLLPLANSGYKFPVGKTSTNGLDGHDTRHAKKPLLTMAFDREL